MPVATGPFVIAAALIYPTLATWLYFLAMPEGAARQATFVAVKLLQFVFPLAWVIGRLHRRPRLIRPSGGDVVEGLATGLAITTAGIAGYCLLLRGGPTFVESGTRLAHKMATFGVTNTTAFVAMAAFYSIVHSLLEEYYWRWFVFGELARRTRLATAIVVSSLGFMAHHVLVVGEFFGDYGLATWLASISVAVGGGIWAWTYQRRGSLYAPWISHALVDAGLMWIGWDAMTRGA